MGGQLASRGFGRAFGKNAKLWEEAPWENRCLFFPKARVGARLGVSSTGAPAGVVSRGFPERSSRIREASLARADTAAPGSSTLDCCGLVWKWAIATFPFYAPSFLVPPLACSAKRGEVFTAAWSTLRKPRLQIAA